MTRSSCVIVGASAAGVSAAVRMRRMDYPGTITLVDVDPRLPYERPPLSKALLDEGTAGLVPIQPAETYRDLDIDLRLGARVVEVDPARLTVRLGDGDVLKSGRLVLATGVRPRKLTVKGADATNVLSLRDAADAGRIGAHLGRGGPLVIVGGGFIGLELAAVAVDRGIEVTVVEAQPQPLTHVLGPDVAALVTGLHREHGVRLLSGVTVAGFLGPAGRVEEVRLSDGRRLPAAAVVVGVGVEPRHELARSARIDTDDHGIPVNEFGQTSRAWIYATGEVASQFHPDLPRRGRIEHWDAALRHGAAVGSTLAGEPVRYTDPPYAWSDQYGATLQLIGRARPTDELVLREGAAPGRFLAFWLRHGRIGAVAGMDAAREIGVVKRLMAAGVLVGREQLTRSDTNLRALLKARSTMPGSRLAN
ncbi:NAD(P)/FAD-dependent oxidoreductase [Amycolatopsis jiangsuensis]|uniref:3-phenylpropionate/trans-cinnamate dioxygenase ferredoxin reductase subunit n=1 Tax=Amycolatopsis jiangsuensis TaxID=1181879 RepID=A0A840ITP8_9PSEU|nr:FAD-dependent oxidoreductase [Amycolatopsis jiangsuensis]MBB4684354.1 3-phenylpropionate/trans-cinnamate dioxygenase ferredoxin reductase subunit [Amycolatopsis jiangsuensis]